MLSGLLEAPEVVRCSGCFKALGFKLVSRIFRILSFSRESQENANTNGQQNHAQKQVSEYGGDCGAGYQPNTYGAI